MKLNKFKKEYNGAPYELRDFAVAAAGVTDCIALKDAAQEFVDAQANFLQMLDDLGVEIG